MSDSEQFNNEQTGDQLMANNSRSDVQTVEITLDLNKHHEDDLDGNLEGFEGFEDIEDFDFEDFFQKSAESTMGTLPTAECHWLPPPLKAPGVTQCKCYLRNVYFIH